MAERYKIESLDLTDEVRKRSQGAFIDLPCGNTHYVIEGEGKEWAVLVHGYATPLFIYDKIAAGLVSAGYKVLRYDLLGRGLTERVKGLYTPALFGDQLEQITDEIIKEPSFILFGTSMGGTITTTFTSRRPERVKKLILLAPAGMHFKAPAYMKLAKIKGIGEILFKTIGGNILVKNCAKELLYSGAEAQEEYRNKFAYYMQYKGMLDATLSSLRNTILNFDEAAKGYVGVDKAGTQVLVIWGTADATMAYYQHEEMEKVVKNMQLITYENSGHIFLYDEGDRTIKDVLAFLEK